MPEVFGGLASKLSGQPNAPYDHVVIDEAQDIGVSHLRFLAAIGGKRPNALFFTGDLGQRIFQQPFSWKNLGVDIQGRSHTLQVNYRTSHQIRSIADRLLGPVVADADGNQEERQHTVSVLNGPPPKLQTFRDTAGETEAVGEWIRGHLAAGWLPHEIAVFVRSEAQMPRALAAVHHADVAFKVLDDCVETSIGHVSICTMPRAKGLEFRGAAVMACDDEVMPLQERIESVGDEANLQEVYETERHLLYVACTRARDELLVTSVDPRSEFLDDLKAAGDGVIS
jgi:superfamily I DNA/RNA helicase